MPIVRYAGLPAIWQLHAFAEFRAHSHSLRAVTQACASPPPTANSQSSASPQEKRRLPFALPKLAGRRFTRYAIYVRSSSGRMRMRTIIAAAAALSLVAGVPAFAAPCKDAKGRFVKCPEKPVKPARCKDAKCKFVKCGAPGSKPV